MSTALGPHDVFGVGLTRVADSGVLLDQHLGPALADHRNIVGMPAYGVLAESVSSAPYWYSFAEPTATVQAWLALTAAAPVVIGDVVRAAAQLAHRDESYGTTTVTVSNDAGAIVCTGLARSVRVGRTTAALEALDRGELSTPRAARLMPPAASHDVPAIDPGWDGRRILSAIRDGGLPPGPLCDLLAMTVVSASDDAIAVDVSPQPWMANPLGAIQGGVIASILGAACSLAGQAHTGPSDRYTLADLSVFYFRSPPVDAGALSLLTTTDRAGRRLATVTATMADQAGTPYARAVADIAYERSEPF